MIILALCLAAARIAAAQPPSFQERLDAAMARVSRLKYMDMDRRYELPIHGKVVQGPGVDFVDRRSSQEVLDSGMSTGCGDTAGVFYELMRPGGAKMLFIQSAEISVANLLGLKASGHTGVALQDPASGKWILVDPTNRKIMSKDWDTASKLYDHRIIGYIGPPEGYFSQIVDPESVGRFFQRTLRTAPKDILNQELVGIDFTLEPSMSRSDGTLANRHAETFALLYSGVDRRFGLAPKRRVLVHLEDGGAKAQGIRCRAEGRAFYCAPDRERPMDERTFSWIEESALKHAPIEGTL